MKVLLLMVFWLQLVASEDVVVTTVYGQLRGSREKFGEKYVDTFKGIPFAQPPTGPLRWVSPRDVSPWSGVRDATSYGPACPQPDKTQPGVNVTLDEDCLYLNVFAPQVTARKPVDRSHMDSNMTYPVMVFIHGGAYVSGTGAIYDSTVIALRDVVVVTINYRLGVLGFLSTGDSAAPGNFGMLDQVLALQWVKKCISSFGGKPNQVTIFGESAGASSVSLHLISPLSKDLFNAVICESGVSLTPWAIATKTDSLPPRKRAEMLGQDLGCPDTTSSSKLVGCLRSKTADALTEAGKTIPPSPSRLEWSPVVDSVSSPTDSFLPENPQALVKKGMSAKVPVIRGINKDEDSNDLASIPGIEKGMTLDYFKNLIHDFAKNRYRSNHGKIEEAIRQIYIPPNMTDPVAVRSSCIQFLSDHDFFAPTDLETNLNAKLQTDNPIFLYEFAYRAEHDPSPKWTGVPHTAELPYVFGIMFSKRKLTPQKWTEKDKQMSSAIIKMWTNFAKYG
ncbi:neuroligin-4, X-linked-like [Gigantopelta aegis]|uniref:neuroligin-4, X-linked-like n=1 Tax=Gigantopelta aegis TaxID=1735272 RepID=UPI001B8889B1|nr:neuroligin-4, X-linked-like [Gigantopelta aegis]